MNPNLSTCFLLPLLGTVDENDFQKLNLQIFVGKENAWGNNLHIHLSNVNHPLAQRISDSSIESYKVDGNTTGYILELSDNDRENIVKPFIEGKYSQIDREYVKTNFPEKEFIGFDVFGKAQYKKLINYKILTKSKELHNWWEERLGCPLPPDAEVWSIPDLKQEVYLYEENSGTRPEPPTVNRLENTGNNTESVQES